MCVCVWGGGGGGRRACACLKCVEKEGMVSHFLFSDQPAAKVIILSIVHARINRVFKARHSCRGL